MKNLFKALAAFQQECPVIHKGTQGYGYTYADLPAIFETINPLLKKYGMGFYQAVEGTSLITTIFHAESGESISNQAEIPQGVQLKGMNDFQVLGSAITYMRRYQLSAMLGIVTDKDTDASGEQSSKWLNPDTKEWNAAVEYLQGGGTLDAIEKKYKLSKANKNRLLDESIV